MTKHIKYKGELGLYLTTPDHKDIPNDQTQNNVTTMETTYIHDTTQSTRFQLVLVLWLELLSMVR